MEEIWKDILGYEGLYQVSNLGRVKSLERMVESPTGNYLIFSKILKPGKTNKGYSFVNLYKNKKPKSRTVHQLVAQAFLNHSPCKYEIVIDHINNNKEDNSLNNLQLVSHRENISKDTKRKSSQYTGVTWHKNFKKWMSTIRINKTRKFLGYFKNEIDAHLEYQKQLNLINGC